MKRFQVEEKYSSARARLTSKVLQLLPFYELGEEIIQAAVAECEFPSGYDFVLFDSTLEIFKAIYEELDALTAMFVNSGPLKVRQKIALALKYRIKLLSKASHVKFMKYFAANCDLDTQAKLTWQTCDNIWHLAGDESTDFNYYSKRGLLFGVYCAAIARYLVDESKDHAATDDFIDNAIENIIKLSSLKNKIKLPELADIPFIRLLL